MLMTPNPVGVKAPIGSLVTRLATVAECVRHILL